MGSRGVRWIVTLGLALAAMALTGCGSEKEEPSAEPTATASPAPSGTAEGRRGDRRTRGKAVKVAGIVRSVRQGGSARRPVVVDLAVGEELISVRLGPAALLEEKGFEVAEGDQLSIVGTPGEKGRGVIVAQRVTRGETTVQLRSGRAGRRARGGAGAGEASGGDG